jgi:predicted nucleic acid-binding Zn ribbon protein
MKKLASDETFCSSVCQALLEKTASGSQGERQMPLVYLELSTCGEMVVSVSRISAVDPLG